MVRERKLIFIIVLLLISIGGGFCSMNLSGKEGLSLSEIYYNGNWSTTSDANLTFNLDYNTAGVKSYFQYDLSISEKEYEDNLSKAYIKFRLPFGENYITFNAGKTNLSWGGGFAFNAGNPYFNKYLTILSAYIPLSLNFDNGHLIYFESFVTPPLLKSETFTGGGRMIFEFGKVLVDSFEIGGVLGETGDFTFYGGLNGNLYFDYGLYTNFSLFSFEDVEFSGYVLKYFGKFNFMAEGNYENDLISLILTGGYQIGEKLGLSCEVFLAKVGSYTALGLSYPIIQGLNAKVKLMRDTLNNYTVVFNLEHSFSQ
ncbi:MAG: hypothetical protein WC162_06630 [Sphaerochaetaceae bacterium]